MLTRLRVQGFKNLLDVDVRFGPFTCIAGPNASGKSNLFDAIRFLHLLTQHPIMEAARLLREGGQRERSTGGFALGSEPRSLFTTFGDFCVTEIRLTADLLVERDVADDFGVPAHAQTSSVRYEVAFRLNETERSEHLELIHESLIPRTQRETRSELGLKASAGFQKSVIQGRRPKPLISTLSSPVGPQIKVHFEGHGGRTVPAPKSSRTVLGGTASSDFPTLLAVHREMQAWQTLMLEPSAMRAPSMYGDLWNSPVLSSRGANLPAVIERLRRDEGQPGRVLSELANRLAELIDDVRTVQIRDDLVYIRETRVLRGSDLGSVAVLTAPRDTWRTGFKETPQTAEGDLGPYRQQLELPLAG